MGLLDKLKRKPAQTEFPGPSEGLDEKSIVEDFADVPRLVAEDNEALDVLTNSIYRSCIPLGFVPSVQIGPGDWEDEVILGVTVRSFAGLQRSFPEDHPGFASFEDGIRLLGPKVAIKSQSKAVSYLFKHYIDLMTQDFEIVINTDTRIQVISYTEQLARARRNQMAAFIRDECALVVWSDHADSIIPALNNLEAAIIDFIFTRNSRLRQSGFIHANSVASLGGHHARSSIFYSPSALQSTVELREPEKDYFGPAAIADPEKAATVQSRSARWIHPVVTGIAAGVVMIILGISFRSIFIQYIYDHNAARFALILVLPLFACMSAFPAVFLVSSLFNLLGPVAQYNKNSQTFSGTKPVRSNEDVLAPITIQMPVYKEDLHDVIIPTIQSLQTAVNTYERQGGTVNIIVCEDGLQVISPADREERIRFYEQHNVAFVARPPHGVDGFERRGKFKKAGNLNYCNKLSLEIEVLMDAMRPSDLVTWNNDAEKALYEDALNQVLAKNEGKTLARGDLRIGEILLLIDSDTRVPSDCLLDASLEMAQCPDVAIIQHMSGVLQVAHHFFENGMAFFTNLIQISIGLAVASGDAAPFVGHNAFLRWSALQEIAHIDEYDGQSRVWSESHVSEDFQVSLRLQTKGWTVRWATYSNSEFLEGVSLTAVDEMSRWQKYAWGCSEIVFNPMSQWHRRGPFSKLFREFLWADIPINTKFSILAYVFSYYAIGSAWILTILNFVLFSMMEWPDNFLISSFEVMFVTLLLFQALSPVSMIILRYRLKIAQAGKLAVQQLLYIPFFTLFFGGLSMEVGRSLTTHLLGIDMSWTMTSKSVVKSNFFLQLPKIFKRFWLQLVIAVITIAGAAVCMTPVVPFQYMVVGTSIVPIGVLFSCHLLWPFVLDPYLATFTSRPCYFVGKT